MEKNDGHLCIPLKAWASHSAEDYSSAKRTYYKTGVIQRLAWFLYKDDRRIREALHILVASQVTFVVKNPPAKQKTWVQSLGLEDPLEKEIATHSSILAWEIWWTEESGGI